MIGQKGLPATHGGVEQHVEHLGRRLAGFGHEVVVYTRPSYVASNAREYLGMELRSRYSIPTKHLDAITHSLVSTFDTCLSDFDVVHYHAIGPCLTSPLARVTGRRVVATIHGQDWRRGKWGGLASLALRGGEELALRVPDTTIVVSKSLAETYAERGFGEVTYIPNGVSVSDEDAPGYLDALGVRRGEYLLFLGRLVPEKGAHYLVDAWKQLGAPVPLVIVGDSSFTDGYVADLREAGSGAIFTGYLQDPELGTVFRNAGLFVMPSDLEGLPLVLLESLAHGTPVLASDIAPNREILGPDGTYFRAGDVSDLTEQLRAVMPRLGKLKADSRMHQDSVRDRFDWDRVALETEAVYRSLFD